MTTRRLSYAADGAERIKADLRMYVGNLNIRGGAEKVVQADFDCELEAWQPDVQYKVESGMGHLSMIQPQTQTQARLRRRIQNEWDIRFGNNLPLDLAVQLNAATADLHLNELPLRRLDLELNASRLLTTLVGHYPLLTQLDFQFNAVKADLQLSGGFPNLKFIDFEVNAGRAVLDFSGLWTHSQDIAIESNATWITIKLPHQVGVRVFNSSSLSMMRHTGLTRRDGGWVNEAYGHSDITLRFDVETNVGKVDFEFIDPISLAV